jgi:SPP1 gp7 family putative phage head morphogenesis protein
VPVHAVKGGYRWGTHGKVYKSKAGAERQVRAIYASGYRGDARVARRKAARLLKASPKAEARYVRDLLHIIRQVHAGVRKMVEREVLGLLEPETRHDAAKSTPPIAPRILGPTLAYTRRAVGPAFDRMAGDVDKDNKEGLALLGIQPGMTPGLNARISQAREDNIRLVANAGRAYAEDVDRIFSDPKNLGKRVEVLRDMLLERGNVSESRAMLIARDQTLKTNAMVSHWRMQSAGVDRYTWSTSQDERVRPMHAALEGQAFAFDDPPVTNEEGEENNPGEDFQCRCIGIPLFEEVEPEEPEPEETPEPEPEAPEPIPEPEIAAPEEIPEEAYLGPDSFSKKLIPPP